MGTFWVGLLAGVLVVAVFGGVSAGGGAAVGVSAGDANELVRNGSFAAVGEGDLPAEWAEWRPDWPQARCTIRRTPQGLLVEAPNRPYAVGGVTQVLRGIRGGQAYLVDVVCRPTNVPDCGRSLIVRLTWTQKGKMLHPAGMLVNGLSPGGRQIALSDVLVAPAEADAALLSLEVKWPQGGAVLWQRASVRPCAPPQPRKVKLGTVYLRPKNSTPEKNLRLWCEKIDQAGKLGLDIVCLCEAIKQAGTQAGAGQCAERIPGPDTEALGAAAARNNLYVVAGLSERDGEALYNTAVLIDRKGGLAGKYRKIHLPREEWRKGVTPGGEWPVFQTDFGKVGIMICYDWFFPEAAGIFARHGAEVLFAPTWGTTRRDQDGRAEGETVFRVRARDNGLYLVPSVYDGSSMVIDPLGRILATSDGENEGVYWAEVDLAAREPLWWVGHWRSIVDRHRMPGTYEAITRP